MSFNFEAKSNSAIDVIIACKTKMQGHAMNTHVNTILYNKKFVCLFV